MRVTGDRIFICIRGFVAVATHFKPNACWIEHATWWRSVVATEPCYRVGSWDRLSHLLLPPREAVVG